MDEPDGPPPPPPPERQNVTGPVPRRLPDFTPFIVIAFVLGLIALGLYLFPAFKTMMNYQDCVGSGRVDCARR